MFGGKQLKVKVKSHQITFVTYCWTLLPWLSKQTQGNRLRDNQGRRLHRFKMLLKHRSSCEILNLDGKWHSCRLSPGIREAQG
jgi:hypothetical protein